VLWVHLLQGGITCIQPAVKLCARRGMNRRVSRSPIRESNAGTGSEVPRSMRCAATTAAATWPAGAIMPVRALSLDTDRAGGSGLGGGEGAACCACCPCCCSGSSRTAGSTGCCAASAGRLASLRGRGGRPSGAGGEAGRTQAGTGGVRTLSGRVVVVGEAVDADDGVATRSQRRGGMRADEARRARHEPSHGELA